MIRALTMNMVASYGLLALALTAAGADVSTSQPTSAQTTTRPAPRFTGRFTPEDLKALFADNDELRAVWFQYEETAPAIPDTLNRIAMGPLVDKLMPFLAKQYPHGLDPKTDLIVMPVPAGQQVELDTGDAATGRYRGPAHEVRGFLLHDISQADFIQVAIRVVQTARQMLDTGDPRFDRRSGTYLRLLAESEVAAARAARKHAKTQAADKEAVRRRIGRALGIYNPATGQFEGEGDWVREWRRFTYVVKDGQFIDRLGPLVEEINRDIELAGFRPDSPLARPGIHFDQQLADLEIVLPAPMMKRFLELADRVERRMAEDHMISIEAVRLTDREILDGALAARLNVLSRGVHDVRRFDTRAIASQLGINSLLAVANRQLHIANLQDIAGGHIPEGADPLVLPSVDLPPVLRDRTATTVGGNFSVGADDIFFDGREQSYGFSYIGPDGTEHALSLDVVDSLREFWDRIERNLIVHKIKKTDKPKTFTVPVGPETKTFEGIAALISQENRDIVITSDQGALVQLSATAGTWLIIQDFDIEPKPGSSTALTSQERDEIDTRVLMMMLLRDPAIDVAVKSNLVETETREQLQARVRNLYHEHKDRPVTPGVRARTYQAVFEQRRRDSIEDAAVEKKERNSKIKLTFYSSQGNIIQQPGLTELGDANDLTSFTTELRPNTITPISSLFTKSTSGAKGSSPLTGVSKGVQSSDEKVMAHLMVRVRFPTLERERHDLQEGRYLGYFDLPLGRTPPSSVNLPFLSSSEHPLKRLATLRVGLMFAALQGDRVRKPFELINPNGLAGTVPQRVWETATTRLLMNWQIISDSTCSRQVLAAQFRRRFVVEVRSLLEYDEDFFNAPNIALRNMAQWNNPDRIVLALNNSTDAFARKRLIQMIDELGQKLVPDDYARNYLAVSPKNIWGRHTLRPLSPAERKRLRRDVANHYLRFMEVYGDAFFEAVSMVLNLGSYRATTQNHLVTGPFRGYRDLVIFSNGTDDSAEPDLLKAAHDKFMILKDGGINPGLFKPSTEYIEDLADRHRRFITRGRHILRKNRSGTFPYSS